MCQTRLRIIVRNLPSTKVFFVGLFIGLCLSIVSCSVVPLNVKPGATFDELAICLEFNDTLEDTDKLLYLDTATTFIEQYNVRHSGLKLSACHNTAVNRLSISVQNTKFVNPDKQALYVAISTLGIAYPLMGGNFGFAWLGFNSSQLHLSLSENLSAQEGTVYRSFYSSPYFKNLDEVKATHMQRFQEFLFETVNELSERNIEESGNQ